MLEIIRVGQQIYTPLNEIVLESGDRLRLSTPLASVLELNQLEGVALLPKAALGVDLVAHTLIRGLGGWGPMVVLSAVILLTSTLTNFLSNNAVAVLLTPIAIQAATAMHVSPRPFLIAVPLGASACFATPIGYQTNTLVYGAGGYKFRDFIKVGLPLNLLFCALAAYLIPKLRPF